MTREEKALIYFKDLRERKFKDYSSIFSIAPKDSVVYEAALAEIEIYDIVIKALEQEPRIGHWIEENINEWSRKVFCSECGCRPPFEHVNNGDVYSASGYGVSNKTKFCPNCGAKMIKPQ